MRSWKVLLALLVLALVTAGCGGGGGGEAETEAGGAASEATEAAGGEESGTEAAAGEQAASDIRAAIVTDVGGLGDQSFNDSANAGLERAAEEFGIETEVLESSAPTDYVNNLTQLAESGFSPIFAVGFLMTDAVTEVAPQFPDTQFAIIDSVVEQPNVASLTFEEQQGSYLVGVVAGLMTQQDTDYTTAAESTVGFLGGLEGPLIRKFQAGYEAGVASVCPDCEVLVQYAGTTPDAFNDPATGQEIALSMNDQGADVVYHASGATGAGLFNAATDRNFFAIGVDSDQAALVPDAPILTSMLKRVDNAVYQAIEAAVNGEFPAGEVTTYGLEEEGIDIAEYGRFADVVPEEVNTAVEEARTAITGGEVEVPTEPAA
jgi:basic membrane protein A